MDIVKMETLLRLSSTLLLVLTACLVGFDAQTKVIFFSTVRKATFRDLNALMALVCIDSVVAAYNLLQLLRCFVFSSFKANQIQSYLCLAWVCFLLDQATVYLVVAINSAALAASFLAITGASNLQWMKLCDKYTRFCIQIGGALLCGYAASLSLALISILSGYSLFRLYSPKRFFLLKAR